MLKISRTTGYFTKNWHSKVSSQNIGLCSILLTIAYFQTRTVQHTSIEKLVIIDFDNVSAWQQITLPADTANVLNTNYKKVSILQVC